MVRKISALVQITDLTAAKPLAWPLLYVLFLVLGMPQYLPAGEANFWIGVAIILLMLRYPATTRGGYRFFWLSMLCAVLYIWLPAQTLLFFALLSAILFAGEAMLGKIPAMGFGVMLLMSPLAAYFAEVFSFPVRLHLSGWAAALLRLLGTDAVAQGNSIAYNGVLFDVDHACMGLSMLVTSLLVCVGAVRIFEIQYQRKLAIRYLLPAMVFFLLLNLGANLIRIICLVYFQMAPGTIAHELTGLACWLLYVLAPGLWGVRGMVRQLGAFAPVRPAALSRPVLPAYQLTHIVLVVLFTVFFRFMAPQADALQPPPEMALPGNDYQYTALSHGVARFKSAASLIYVKNIHRFYSTDHNPSICWRGSGYHFSRVKMVRRGKAELYMGVLEKEGVTLHTAWWYEYGSHRTCSQYLWRMNNLRKGWSYRLVNITTASKAGLEKEIAQWMAKAP